MKCIRYTLYCPMLHRKPPCFPATPMPEPCRNQEYAPLEMCPSPRKATLEVTFFDRVGDDFVRTCTTLRQEDGSCAKGTLLDPTSPAYNQLIKGMDYVGEVFIFGHSYFPKYVPIKNNEGRVIGAICVGKCIS